MFNIYPSNVNHMICKQTNFNRVNNIIYIQYKNNGPKTVPWQILWLIWSGCKYSASYFTFYFVNMMWCTYSWCIINLDFWYVNKVTFKSKKGPMPRILAEMPRDSAGKSPPWGPLVPSCVAFRQASAAVIRNLIKLFWNVKCIIRATSSSRSRWACAAKCTRGTCSFPPVRGPALKIFTKY